MKIKSFQVSRKQYFALMLHFLSYNIVATLISLMLSVNKYNWSFSLLLKCNFDLNKFLWIKPFQNWP